MVEDLKRRIDNLIFPIVYINDIVAFGVLMKEIFAPSNIHIYVVCLIIQTIVTIILLVLCRKYRNELNIIENFADSKLSLFLAIKMMLNLKSKINETHIEEAILVVEVKKPICHMSEFELLTERYDCRFIWNIRGENTIHKELDKIYFRLAADNTVKLSNINFRAKQYTSDELRMVSDTRWFLKNIEEDSLGEFMEYDKNNVVNKGNFYLLALEFNNALKEQEDFNIKVSYDWPKCFNPITDYLLIDPYNFSKDMKKFKVYIKIDDKIITRHTNARLKRILRKSWKKLDAEGIQKLKYELGYQKSDDVKCEKNKYIYYVEITRNE